MIFDDEKVLRYAKQVADCSLSDKQLCHLLCDLVRDVRQLEEKVDRNYEMLRNLIDLQHRRLK